MTTKLRNADPAKIVEIAQSMLDGALGIVEGSRRLNDLRAALGIDHLDEDFVGFVAIDSETDTLPIGEVRKLWNKLSSRRTGRSKRRNAGIGTWRSKVAASSLLDSAGHLTRRCSLRPLAAAERQDVRPHRMAVSRDHILREVRRTAEGNGGKPLGRLSFFTETGIKESDWRGTYWARWNDVLRDAGFGPNALVEARDDDTLLERFAALALQLGRIPVKSEMRLKKRSDPSFPNEKTYARFGSKTQLLARLREYSLQHPQYQSLISQIDALSSPERESAPVQEVGVTVEIGTVYLLRSGRFYKIGRSNAVGRREREIALQLPEKASLVHVIRTDDPPGIEAYWHRRFADRRKNGEWFDLSAADVSAFRRRKFM